MKYDLSPRDSKRSAGVNKNIKTHCMSLFLRTPALRLCYSGLYQRELNYASISITNIMKTRLRLELNNNDARSPFFIGYCRHDNREYLLDYNFEVVCDAMLLNIWDRCRRTYYSIDINAFNEITWRPRKGGYQYILMSNLSPTQAHYITNVANNSKARYKYECFTGVTYKIPLTLEATYSALSRERQHTLLCTNYIDLVDDVKRAIIVLTLELLLADRSWYSEILS